MKLICVPIRPLGENVYIYYDELTLCAVVIDPGGDADKIFAKTQNHNLTVKAILLTHGHFDHIGGVAALREFTNAPVYACVEEGIVLSDAFINASDKYCGKAITIKSFEPLNDGETLRFDNFSLTLIHTPGHTIGSSCFYDSANKALFTGDTLFFRTIGSSDFATGDESVLIASITNKILTLPDDTVIYPGHGKKTLISFEKQNNPYI